MAKKRKKLARIFYFDEARSHARAAKDSAVDGNCEQAFRQLVTAAQFLGGGMARRVDALHSRVARGKAYDSVSAANSAFARACIRKSSEQ